MLFSCVDLQAACRELQPGYLINYRGKGLVSSWIQFATAGEHSHTAMVVSKTSCDPKDILIAEVREFIGGRTMSLFNHLTDHEGTMDFFRPNTTNFPEWDLQKTVNTMKHIARHAKYNWWNIVKIGVRRTPFLWRLFDRGTRDDQIVEPWKHRWHCSDSFAAACQYGGLDVVPHVPNALVTPADLTRSLAFTYRFSL